MLAQFAVASFLQQVYIVSGRLRHALYKTARQFPGLSAVLRNPCLWHTAVQVDSVKGVAQMCMSPTVLYSYPEAEIPRVPLE